MLDAWDRTDIGRRRVAGIGGNVGDRTALAARWVSLDAVRIRVTYQYWFPNGQLQGTETTAQHALELKTPGSGRVTYTYDPDGNAITETHHHGFVAGVTTKWYDGADRLVETSLPVDPTDKYYPAPWLTRYKYDITAGGTDEFYDASGSPHALTGRGGVFAVDLYIPPGAVGAPHTGWVDATGITRDAVDRVTATYGSSPAAGAQPLQTFTNTYDGSPAFLGWLTGFSDSLGHSGSVAYDGAGRVTAAQYTDGTPAKTFSYSWDGQLASATAGGLGTESYTYDFGGHLASATEPKSSTAYTSPAHFTYNRYNDGTTKSLSVSSSALSVSNLLQYARRIDGRLSKEIVNYPADGRTRQTFSWTYSPAGRFVSSADDLKSPSSTVNYDINGQPIRYSIPAGLYPALSFDPENNLIGSGGYPIGPNNGAVYTNYQYNVRGELVASTTNPPTGFIPNYVLHSIEGLELPDPANPPTFPSTIAYDALNGAKLGQHVPASTKYGAAATIDSVWSYDADGRFTRKTDTLSGGQNATVTATRAYDFNNQLIAGTCSPTAFCSGGQALSYTWTATGKLALLTGNMTRNGQPGYGAGKSETLHWAGGQPLFSTNANGSLDDLKIGALADITTITGGGGGKPGLTIWDRELDGRQTSWHSSAGIGTWLPPGDPTLGYNLPFPDAHGILPVQIARTDSFTDRHNVFQGARVYDYEADEWTSPDAAPGSLDDSFSYRRYLYDNANPLSNSDPSGNAPNASNGYCCLTNGNDDNNFLGDIIGGIIGFFAGLFGGGGHSSPPAPPPQVEPDDPETYAVFNRASNFAAPLGAILFGIPDLLAPELGGVEAAATGLGGEVAGAAGVETGVAEAATSVKSAHQLGVEGETAVRNAYNIGDKVPIDFGGRIIIPDGLNRTALSEVKNVSSLSFTNQLRTYSTSLKQMG